jgi:SET domain
MRLLLEYVTAVLFLSSKEREIYGTSKNLLPVLTSGIDDTTKTVRNTIIDKKYERLLEWMKSKDGIYISEKLTIRPSNRGGGYGAFVVSNTIHDDGQIGHDNVLPVIEKNEILFTVPRSACITLDDALNDNYYGEGFTALIERAGPGANTVVLAGYMAAEWLKCCEISSEINESQYGPYLATLPWIRGVNSQEHVLYWDDSQIESLLKGSMCYGEAVDLRKEMKIATKVLNTIIGRALLEKEQESAFRLPWERKEPVTEVKGLANAIMGAFVSVLTRAFEDDYGDGNGQEKMVPLLDMLQHSDQPNVSHFMRKSDGAVEVRAKEPMKPGDELLNQYRSEAEENLPYHRFFTRFGFIPGVQEPIENLLKDKSTILFAQKAEV